MQALVASSANLPVVYNAHEAGQVKGYPQTPDIRGARAPENYIYIIYKHIYRKIVPFVRLGRLASLANNNIHVHVYYTPLSTTHNFISSFVCKYIYSFVEHI